MKASLLTKVYALILLAIFGGIVVHAPFIVGMETLFPSGELIFKSWKELLMLPALLITIALLWRDGRWRELSQDIILRVAILYILLHFIIAAALLNGPAATIAGLFIDLRYVLFFVLVYILLKLVPAYKEWFIRVALAGAVAFPFHNGKVRYGILMRLWKCVGVAYGAILERLCR